MRDLHHTDVSWCECEQTKALRCYRGAADQRLGHHFERPQGCPPEQYPVIRALGCLNVLAHPEYSALSSGFSRMAATADSEWGGGQRGVPPRSKCGHPGRFRPQGSTFCIYFVTALPHRAGSRPYDSPARGRILVVLVLRDLQAEDGQALVRGAWRGCALVSAGVCWCLLVFVGVCWCLLVVVCWCRSSSSVPRGACWAPCGCSRSGVPSLRFGGRSAMLSTPQGSPHGVGRRENVIRDCK